MVKFLGYYYNNPMVCLLFYKAGFLFSSLTMIVIAADDQADNCHLNHILTLVFDAMVLLCGQDELVNIKNVERFKKEIKVCTVKLLKIRTPKRFAVITRKIEQGGLTIE